MSIEEDKDREIAEIDRRAQSLYQKQGRSDRFKTTAERDAWLKGQIKEADHTLKQKKSEVHTLENDLKEIRATQSNDETDRAGMEAELIAEEEKLAEFESKYKKAMSERNEAQKASARNFNARITKSTTPWLRAKKRVKKRDKQLEFSMPRDLQRGMAAVQRIVKEHNIEGVHGPLIELMQTDERFHSAIEASAGNQLFHIVVDHDDTASRVIEYLNKEKGGRVTFLPLNRMAPPNITYPEGSDAFPLVSKLKYEEKFDSAFKQVFARVLICRNIDVAVAKAGSSRPELRHHGRRHREQQGHDERWISRHDAQSHRRHDSLARTQHQPRRAQSDERRRQEIAPSCRTKDVHRSRRYQSFRVAATPRHATCRSFEERTSILRRHGVSRVVASRTD